MACMLPMKRLYLYNVCVELINYGMSVIMRAAFAQNSCSLNDSQKKIILLEAPPSLFQFPLSGMTFNALLWPFGYVSGSLLQYTELWFLKGLCLNFVSTI